MRFGHPLMVCTILLIGSHASDLAELQTRHASIQLKEKAWEVLAPSTAHISPFDTIPILIFYQGVSRYEIQPVEGHFAKRRWGRINGPKDLSLGVMEYAIPPGFSREFLLDRFIEGIHYWMIAWMTTTEVGVAVARGPYPEKKAVSKTLPLSISVSHFEPGKEWRFREVRAQFTTSKGGERYFSLYLIVGQVQDRLVCIACSAGNEVKPGELEAEWQEVLKRIRFRTSN